MELKKNTPSNKWRPSTLNAVICYWIPLLCASVSKPDIGLTESGLWVQQMKTGELREINGSFPLPVFPFLTKTRVDFFSDLDRVLIENGIPLQATDSFPISDVLCAALTTSQSEYWQGLALGWIEHNETNPDLVNAIQLVSEKGLSQKNRHRARSLLKVIAAPTLLIG